MAQTRILVLNGPNLGVLGRRQPEIYGNRTLHDLPEMMQDLMGKDAETIQLVMYQANSEGGLIDRLEQAVDEGVKGIVLNAGAYSHTSLALADCLAWIGIPCVEVHLSNVAARQEPLRQTSLMAKHCLGVVSGFGLNGYPLAFLALLEHLRGAA